MRRLIKIVILVMLIIISSMSTVLAGTTQGYQEWKSFPLTYRGHSNYLDTYAIQNILNYYSYDTHKLISSAGGVDGSFGPGTEDAVEKFQEEEGLYIDGKVGTNTWGEMYMWLIGPCDGGDGYDYYANWADPCCQELIFRQRQSTGKWQTRNQLFNWVTFEY